MRSNGSEDETQDLSDPQTTSHCRTRFRSILRYAVAVLFVFLGSNGIAAAFPGCTVAWTDLIEAVNKHASEGAGIVHLKSDWWLFGSGGQALYREPDGQLYHIQLFRPFALLPTWTRGPTSIGNVQVVSTWGNQL